MKRYISYLALSAVLIFSLIINIILVIKISGTDDSDFFKNHMYSIVEIKAVKDGVGESFGTGEFIDTNGTLITNAHVVTYKKMGVYNAFENIYIRFSFEEDYKKVSLVKYDIDKDLAVLMLEDNNIEFIPLKTRDSSNLKFGESVYAIGNLNNLGLSITSGKISNPSINVTYEDNTRNVIQCDLTIADGNSGGALLDNKGNLIGITTFRLKDNQGNVIYGISYCITINAVLEYIESK